MGDEEAISAIVLRNLQVDTGRLRDLYEQTGRSVKKEQYLRNTAQMAIRFAGDIAHVLGHEYIGTEHLLLAIFKITGSEGCRILRQIDLSYESVLEQIKSLVVCKNGK